jgi:hypothetical protein
MRSSSADSVVNHLNKQMGQRAVECMLAAQDGILCQPLA